MLEPILYLPDGQGPFRLVVIVNSSAGANDIFLTELPKALNKAGIAAVALDTFSPRGIKRTTFDQSQISTFTMALDALAVARHFAKDPRISRDKIVVSGHSKGAMATVLLANVQFYRRFRVEPAFTAGVAFSPACFLQYSSPGTVFALYALMGAKDDRTPPRYCIPMFERMNGNPHSVSYEVIPGTIHSWSLEGPRVRFNRRIPNMTFGPCKADGPYFIDSPRHRRSSVTDEVLTTTEFRTRCAGGTGATIGGDREILGTALSKAIDWLESLDFSQMPRKTVRFVNQQEHAGLDAEVRKLVGAVLAVADGFRNYCRNKRDGRRFRAAQKLSAEGTVLAYGATRQAGGFLRTECAEAQLRTPL